MKYWLVIEKECIGSNTHMLGTRTKDHNFRTKEEAELFCRGIQQTSQHYLIGPIEKDLKFETVK